MEEANQEVARILETARTAAEDVYKRQVPGGTLIESNAAGRKI